MTPAPPTPAVAPALLKVRRYSRLFVWTMCGAWLLTMAPMVYRLGILAVALVAIVLGVLAFWSTFGLQNMATLRIMLGLGGAIAGGLALVGMFWLLIAPEVIALDSCKRTSLTPQGDLVCQQQFHDSVKARYGFDAPY